MQYKHIKFSIIQVYILNYSRFKKLKRDGRCEKNNRA